MSVLFVIGHIVELEEWIVKRLEKPANTPVGDLDLYGAVHYRSKKGYYFKIREAYGILGKDVLYVRVACLQNSKIL